MMFERQERGANQGPSAGCVRVEEGLRQDLHSEGQEPRRWSFWDGLGMSAGFLLVLAVAVVNGRGRLFWEDEMLGSMLLRDASWAHMIRAWRLGADGGGFLFYLLGRGWFHLFGSGVVAFRLFSAVGFGLAFCVLWATLRRQFTTAVVAFACFNTMFFSPPLTMHYMEGRFYGLMVLNTALALWLVVRLDEIRGQTPWRWYLATFAIHGALTTSHLLGVVYSFFLLLAIALTDRIRGRRRWALYFAGAASWLLLLPERTAIVAAGEVGKPHFWTKAPHFWRIVGAFTGFSPEIGAVLGLLVLAALLLRRTGGGTMRAKLMQGVRQRPGLPMATACLLLVPVALLVQGLTGTWLFVDRYLQPVALGVASVTAWLLTVCVKEWRARGIGRQWPLLSRLVATGALAGYGLLAVFWIFHHVAQLTPTSEAYDDVLTARLPPGLPVVVEDAFTFTELMSRQSDAAVHYTFLLDWPWAVSAGAPRLEVMQYHLMQNWRRAGYFASHIEDADSFLRQHPQFLVLHNGVPDPSPQMEIEIGNPLTERLAALPGYEVHPLLVLDRFYREKKRDTVSLVCHDGCGVATALLTTPEKHCELLATGATCCQGKGCALPAPPKPPRFWQIRRWFE